MGRRGGRKNRDDDDSLERSYLAKRAKVEEGPREAAAPEVAVRYDAPETQTSAARSTINGSQPFESLDEESAKIERLRLKKQRRKEQKKLKAMERQAAQEKQTQTERAARLVAESTNKKATKLPAAGGSMVACRKGVKYQDLVVGKGPCVQDRKKIHVKYVLRMKHPTTGKILDSSDHFGFRVGRGEVIEGWDIGLEGMRQGGTRDLVVPPEAGYGRKNIGAGVGGILYFRVTLLQC